MGLISATRTLSFLESRMSLPPPDGNRASAGDPHHRRGQIQAMSLGIPGSTRTVLPTQWSRSQENWRADAVNTIAAMPGNTAPAKPQRLQHLPQVWSSVTG